MGEHGAKTGGAKLRLACTRGPGGQPGPNKIFSTDLDSCGPVLLGNTGRKGFQGGFCGLVDQYGPIWGPSWLESEKRRKFLLKLPGRYFC